MKRRKRKPLEQQIQCVADGLGRSVITIRAWVREGLNVYDPDDIVKFWRWKQSRIRNRPNPEKPARRVWPPC